MENGINPSICLINGDCLLSSLLILSLFAELHFENYYVARLQYT